MHVNNELFGWCVCVIVQQVAMFTYELQRRVIMDVQCVYSTTVKH